MKKICNKMKQINKLGTKSVISKGKKICKESIFENGFANYPVHKL